MKQMGKVSIIRRGLSLLLSLVLVFGCLFGTWTGGMFGGAEEVYAKERGEKNKQACDSCEAVRDDNPPAGYDAVIEGKVYSGGNSYTKTSGVEIDTDPTDFAKPLPYGNVYVDASKLNWDNPNGFIIDIKDDRFQWVSISDEPLKDAKNNTSTNDPMGVKDAGPLKYAGDKNFRAICYVGPLQSYLANITDKATAPTEGVTTTNVITPDAGVPYLYRITYLNAVTLPNGTKGNLVLTMKEVQIETSVTVNDETDDNGKFKNSYKLSYKDAQEVTHEYEYTKAFMKIQGENQLSNDTGYKITDAHGNNLNQNDTQVLSAEDAKTLRTAINGVIPGTDDDLPDSWGVAKNVRNATGNLLDLDIEVTDAEGNEVEGTISYAAHDMDFESAQTIWGRPLGDEFSEGLTIVSGSQSYALVPDYSKLVEGVKKYYKDAATGATTLDTGWAPVGPGQTALDRVLDIKEQVSGQGHADGVRFASPFLLDFRGANGDFSDAIYSDTQVLTFQGDGPSANNNSIKDSDLAKNSMTSVAKKQIYAKLKETDRPSAGWRKVTPKLAWDKLGNHYWKTYRNDDDVSFDSGFAVLLDSKKTSIQWSGSRVMNSNINTTLFDPTLFTYIEQTHGTGGGIYMENYNLSQGCAVTPMEGVVTMGRGSAATVTAVPEDGYRIKEFQIGGAELASPITYTLVYGENGKITGIKSGDKTTQLSGGKATIDGIEFEVNDDRSIDVSANITDPRHIHVDFDADYYFYKIWKGGEPTKLNMTAVPYAYIFTDVTLPVPTGEFDGDNNPIYEDTHFSIDGTEYTAADGTKYVLNANNTLETVEKDPTGEYPLITLPHILKGNSFVLGEKEYPVTVEFGVNFASAPSGKLEFTVDNTDDYADYVTTLDESNDISPGNIVWKIKYPTSGVSGLGWPALPIETEPNVHNRNHVERNYWFVTEEAPGWSMEGYDNTNAEVPGVVSDAYYDNYVWRAASVKDFDDATQKIQVENKTKNAFMSVFSLDAANTTTAKSYGGEITNIPSVVVKADKNWVDFENQFQTRQEIWLHIDATVGNTVTKDILPPQKLAVGTDEKQSVTWGDKSVYETNQENIEIIHELADIPLKDESGRRVTYTDNGDGSYTATNGITYWLNELVKVTTDGTVIQYTIRETLDAEGEEKVEYATEDEGLIGYTAETDEVAWKDMDKTLKTEIGEGDDVVEVTTYKGELTNELALIDFTVTKIWDDSPATKHGDDVDPEMLKEAYTLYESGEPVVDGEMELQPATAEAYVKTDDTEVGTLEITNGEQDGKVTTTFVWHSIPKYVGDGTDVYEAVYSILEEQLEGYEAPIYGGDSEEEALDEGTITNMQNPPTPEDDETWGLRGEEQTGEPSFEEGTAEIETIKLIDPETGEPTDETTVNALDENGDVIGTYTLNEDGTVTFTPNDDFVGDPQPCLLRATDKNGFEVDAKYQPHVIDDTDTETVSRTIHYIYSTDGSEASADVTQTATWTRKATGLDPDTHEPIWGDWELVENGFEDVESPEIEGWYPSSDLVPGITDLEYGDDPEDITIVYSPYPPEGDHKTSFGPKGAVQKGTPPFTEGTGTIEKYELIDEEGNVVDELPAYDKDGNEVGTYTIDTETGEVTFTPTDPEFVGTPTPATVRATDDLGETATGTYTPTSIDNIEDKTLKKTITHIYDDGTDVLDEDGNPLVSEETLYFHREGIVDPDTGEITWPNWEPQTFEDWESPDVEGYTPHKDGSEGETVTPEDGDKEDQIVYKRDTYTVIYTNGSNGKSDGKGDETGVPYGDSVKGGNTVTPDEGYEFTGKYTYTITQKDGTVITGETDDPTSVVVTGDVVFTPLYKKLPQVTYIDPATGRVVKKWTSFNEDGTEPDAPENPDRDGYTFDGWDREEDEEGNVIYKAKWKPWKYTIKYDANGGEGTMEDQKFTSDDGEAESKRNQFTREGYKFTGFKAKDKDGNYLKDKDGNELFFSDPKDFMDYLESQGPDSEVTLEAQWKKLPTATYIDPATGRTIQVTLPFLDETTEPQAPKNPTREGYTFDGWDREVDEEGNVLYKARWKEVPPAPEPEPEPEPEVQEEEQSDGTGQGEKKSPDKESKKSGVKTGDEADIVFWLCTTAVAGLGAVLLVRRRKLTRNR